MSSVDVPVLQVVAAVLHDAAGRVLIAERPAGKSMAGWWEFPGGKLAPGESELDALRRELREELGVELQQASPWLQLEHRYPHQQVQLSVWQVQGFAGEASSREGQRLEWCRPEQLSERRLLPADGPIVQALKNAARG